MGQMIEFSILFIASDLELPKTQGNVFLICPFNNADFSTSNSDLNNPSFCVVMHLKRSIIKKNPNPKLPVITGCDGEGGAQNRKQWDHQSILSGAGYIQ